VARSRKPYIRPPSVAGPKRGEIIERVRATCRAFPNVTERSSHGMASFFIGDKPCFMYVTDNHHSDGRFALWCAAPDGMQRMLVESDPDRYFIPPYVGPSGWVGVRLDRKTPWKQIASVIENAWLTKAPPKLLATYRATPTRSSRSRHRPSAG
jgi:hypothetical protein